MAIAVITGERTAPPDEALGQALGARARDVHELYRRAGGGASSSPDRGWAGWVSPAVCVRGSVVRRALCALDVIGTRLGSARPITSRIAAHGRMAWLREWRRVRHPRAYRESGGLAFLVGAREFRPGTSRGAAGPGALPSTPEADNPGPQFRDFLLACSCGLHGPRVSWVAHHDSAAPGRPCLDQAIPS